MTDQYVPALRQRFLEDMQIKGLQPQTLDKASIRCAFPNDWILSIAITLFGPKEGSALRLDPRFVSEMINQGPLEVRRVVGVVGHDAKRSDQVTITQWNSNKTGKFADLCSAFRNHGYAQILTDHFETRYQLPYFGNGLRFDPRSFHDGRQPVV